MKPLPVLVNAMAGGFARTSPAEALPAAAEEAGVAIELLVCDGQGEMRQAVARLRSEGVDSVIVAGGDGTIAMVVQELARTTVTLGIIPAGTANNFATALGLPRDFAEALRIARDGVVQCVDLGRVGDRYFTEAAGVGLFANSLVFYGRRTGKNPFRLLYTVVKLLFSTRAHRMKLTIDGEEVVERAVMCTIANTSRLGLGAPVAPEATPTDGWLDLVVIGDLTRWELISYYLSVMAKTHLARPKARTIKARRVMIEALRALNVHCDDRVIGTTPAEFSVVRGALRVMVAAP